MNKREGISEKSHQYFISYIQTQFYSSSTSVLRTLAQKNQLTSSWVRFSFKPELFSGFRFVTTQIEHITAKIFKRTSTKSTENKAFFKLILTNINK